MLNSYGRYGKAQRIFPEIIRENSGKFLFIWKNPCSSAQHKILCVELNHWHPRELGLLPDPESSSGIACVDVVVYSQKYSPQPEFTGLVFFMF
jgi:hypothetical protein